MPNRNSRHSSPVPGKRVESTERTQEKESRRHEGAVNEHRRRVSRNHENPNETAKSSSSEH